MKKGTIVAIIISLLVILGLTACGEDKHPNEIRTPGASGFYEGEDYNIALKDFQEHGFTNIELDPIDDLITGWLTKDGEVEKVYVNNDPTYSADQWVPKDSTVKISYHTFPSKESVEADIKDEDETTDSVTVEENTSSIDDVNENIEDEDETGSSDEIIAEEQSSNEEESTSDENASTSQINEDDAWDYFDQCVRASCPYGVKLHGTRMERGQINDTAIYFKEPVTVENAFGNKYETYAHGTVEYDPDTKTFFMNDLMFD